MAEADARVRSWIRQFGVFEWGPYALATALAISAVLIRVSFSPMHTHISYLLLLAAEAPGLIVFCALALAVVWLAVRIRRTRQVLTTVLSSMSDAAVLTDATGKVVFLNAAGEVLSGCRRRDAVGKRFGEVVRLTGAGEESQIEDPVESVLSLGRTVDLANGVMLRSIDGAKRRIQGTATPVRDHGGRVKGMTVLFRDITSGKELQARRQAAETREAFARLASGVAHEFNNSLTVITGHAELLRSRADAQEDAPLRESTEEILRACKQAASLTRELMVSDDRRLAQSPLAKTTHVISHQPKREQEGSRDVATILVAERDRGVRALMGAALKEKGYVVLEAARGFEAAAIVAEELNRLDLIVADATMSVMGEHGLIERLTMLRPELKILYLSGGSDTLSRSQEQANGRVRFLSKPFTTRSFLDRVESLLGR